MLGIFRHPVISQMLGHDPASVPKTIDITQMSDALVRYNKGLQAIYKDKNLHPQEKVLAVKLLNGDFMGEMSKK